MNSDQKRPHVRCVVLVVLSCAQAPRRRLIDETLFILLSVADCLRISEGLVSAKAIVDERAMEPPPLPPPPFPHPPCYGSARKQQSLQRKSVIENTGFCFGSSRANNSNNNNNNAVPLSCAEPAGVGVLQRRVWAVRDAGLHIDPHPQRRSGGDRDV